MRGFAPRAKGHGIGSDWARNAVCIRRPVVLTQCRKHGAFCASLDIDAPAHRRWSLESPRSFASPIQLGENFYGPRDLYKAVQKCAGDFAMPDLMRIGGVGSWLKAAAIAGAAGGPTSTHLYPEFAAHLMRVTETADWLAWQDWAEPVRQMPYDIRDGLPHIPGVPGIGLAWNEDAVVADQVAL